MKAGVGIIIALLSIGALAGCEATGSASSRAAPDMDSEGGLSSSAESAMPSDDGASSSAAPGMPSAGSATDVTDFTGARAGQAEGGLRALGYEPIRSQGLTSWWFNRDTGACAEIVTSDGRYSSVTMLPAQDC